LFYFFKFIKKNKKKKNKKDSSSTNNTTNLNEKPKESNTNTNFSPENTTNNKEINDINSVVEYLNNNLDLLLQKMFFKFYNLQQFSQLIEKNSNYVNLISSLVKTASFFAYVFRAFESRMKQPISLNSKITRNQFIPPTTNCNRTFFKMSFRIKYKFKKRIISYYETYD
jgi:hypothetical protein